MNKIRISRKTWINKLLLAAALSALSVPFASAQSTWDGGGANSDLSNATNWVGDVAPTFTGGEAGSTNNLVYDNAVNTSVNLGANTRRGVSNISFVGLNVGAFNFTNTGRWVLSYGGKVSMDSAVTNAIGIGRIGFGTNAGGGSYTLENNASLSSATMANVSFTAANTNTSTLILDGSNTGTNIFTGASGNVAITKNGAGRWQLSSITTTGGFTMNSGILALAGNNAMGAGPITINGGTVGSVTTSRSVSNNIGIAGNFQLGGVSGGGQSTTFSGNWDLGGGNRTITMGNSATMSGTITNGNLTIKDGTLNLSGTGLIANNTGFNLVGTNAAATLNIGAITASGLTVDNFSASTNTAISLTNKSLAIGGDNSSTTVRAAITGTGGSLIKNGSGTLTLGSSSSTYTGGTSLNGGAIAIASDNAFGTGTVTIADGTRIGSYATTARTISNNVTVNGNFTVGGFNNSTTFNGAMDLGASTRTVTLDNSATVGGAVTGLGGLIVTSTTNRSLTLGGNNTYSGATTVSGSSILRVNGTLASSSVIVDVGATLGGSGVISNATTINGIHSPGNSPGLQTFVTDLSYGGAATFSFELISNATGVRGTDFDAVNVGGNLSITNGAQFNITLNGVGSAVDFTLGFWGSNQSWLVFDSTGVGTTSGNFGIGSVSLDISGNNYSAFGSFATSVDVNNDLYLNWTAVPEPSTYALIGMAAAAFAGYTIRRRKRARE